MLGYCFLFSARSANFDYLVDLGDPLVKHSDVTLNCGVLIF